VAPQAVRRKRDGQHEEKSSSAFQNCAWSCLNDIVR